MKIDTIIADWKIINFGSVVIFRIECIVHSTTFAVGTDCNHAEK